MKNIEVFVEILKFEHQYCISKFGITISFPVVIQWFEFQNWGLTHLPTLFYLYVNIFSHHPSTFVHAYTHQVPYFHQGSLKIHFKHCFRSKHRQIGWTWTLIQPTQVQVIIGMFLYFLDKINKATWLQLEPLQVGIPTITWTSFSSMPFGSMKESVI